MKYNLAKNSYITNIGNVDLTVGQILDLVDYDISNVITISGSEDHVFGVEIDLGGRIKINEIQYFFNSSTSSGTIALGIEFYHKNESFENYSKLDTQIGNGYYYTTVPDISAPRFVQCRHSVSGTGIVGDVDSFGILNDDDIIDFGEEGDLKQKSFILSLDEGENIKEIAIYNDGNVKSTAYAVLEPQGTDVDERLFISATSTGPWTGIRGQDEKIASVGSWGSGNHNDTGVVGGSLVTTTGIGAYTTRIFEKNSAEKFSYIDLDTTPVENAIVAVDAEDVVKTIEIRSSKIKPKDYSLYRLSTSRPYSSHQKFLYKDYWRETGELKYTSGDIGSSVHQRNLGPLSITVDNVTEKSVGFYSSHPAGSPHKGFIRLFTLTREENKVEVILWEGYTALSFVPYRALLDRVGGVWIYLYTASSDSGYWLDNDGYFLGHFDQNFSSTFKVRYDQPFVFDCDVVYDTGELWYTDLNNTQVVKLSTTGEGLVSYDGYEIRGICTTSDGGCWFVSDVSLHRLDKNGILIDSIENIGEVKLSKVVRDGDENLWIRDNNVIKLITLSGQVIFSITIPNSAEIHAISSGLWVQCITAVGVYWKFVGKGSMVIEQEFECDSDRSPGFLDHVFDDSRDVIYPSRFPVYFDSVWQNLEWRKIAVDTYVFPSEDYHQLRLILRANESFESPVVDGIYIQKSLEVKDIHPKNSKNIYLKVQMGGSDINLLGEYNTNLKVRWDLPV